LCVCVCVGCVCARGVPREREVGHSEVLVTPPGILGGSTLRPQISRQNAVHARAHLALPPRLRSHFPH